MSADELWKQDDGRLPDTRGAAEICTMARRRELESRWQRWIAIFAAVCLAIAFAHNAWTIEQTWVRLGQVWMLAVAGVYLWTLIRRAPDRQAAGESCAGFLMRSAAGKRDGYRAFGRAVISIVPAVLASWHGGGAALKARAMGLSPESIYYRYLNSGWPFVATCVLLTVVWLAFLAATKKASRELEALRERVAAQ